MKWLLAVILLATLGVTGARAQFVGALDHDIPLIEQQIAQTLSATEQADEGASRLAMETLYRLWRTFRSMNIDAHPNDPLVIVDFEAAEERLWEASLSIDANDLAQAHASLRAATVPLAALRDRYAAKPPPAPQ